MPTDDGLPTFHITTSADRDPYKSLVTLSEHYRPAEPTYVKERSRNPDEYACALIDAHYPDILYAQAIAKPHISTPSLNIEDVRKQRNGGSPILPNITLPSEFTIQLYNPESQIIVKHTKTRIAGTSYWDFTLPMRSFRQPTGSQLDAEVARSSALPPTGVSTFRWRKDGGVVTRASLRCTLLSTANTASHDASARRKGGGEPDITLAIMDKLQDLSIYEPNLKRVDVEDRKGLELVLLLTAAVIADVYFSPPAHIFNINPQSSVTPRSPVSPSASRTNSASSPTTSKLVRTPPAPIAAATVVDSIVYAETARLQREQAEHERRRLKAEQAEERRVRKLVQDEERAERRRLEAINVETERLKREYSQDVQAWETLQRQYRQPQQQTSAYAQASQLNNQVRIQVQAPQVPIRTQNEQQGSYGLQVNNGNKNLGQRKKSSALLNVFGGGSGSASTSNANKRLTLTIPNQVQSQGKLMKKKKSSFF